jgi:hypothetical protein
MMRVSFKQFISLLCYGYFALFAVSAFAQTKSDAPTITVYQTPT